MKIAILVQRFPPKWLAGTEMASYNLAKYMGKNHKVSVITSHDEDMSNQSNIDGFDVYRIPRSRIRFFGFLLFWFKMFLIIRRLKPEIIHVQGLYMAMPAVLAKKVLNISYIISGQGSDVYTSWPFKELISKWGLNNSKISIALTEDMKNEMQKISNKKIEIVPNGIDNIRFNLNKYESRKELGIDQKQKIVVFIGRLEPVKGLKYLIESINILKDMENNLKLLVIGDGNESHYLKLLVKMLKLDKEVMFIGKIPNDKIPKYLTASDIFVLPSLSEGFPVVLLEAMAAGLPIITTKIRGLAEIVQEGVNGFLVNPKSPNELADKITLILNDESLKKKIFIANKEKSKVYNWKNIVKMLECMY